MVSGKGIGTTPGQGYTKGPERKKTKNEELIDSIYTTWPTFKTKNMANKWPQ